MTPIEFVLTVTMLAVVTFGVFVMTYAVLMDRFIHRDAIKVQTALQQLREAISNNYALNNEERDMGEPINQKAS